MRDLSDLLVRVERAGAASQRRLLEEQNANGWWEGELSASALSTAVAVLALGAVTTAEEWEQTTRDGFQDKAKTSGEEAGTEADFQKSQDARNEDKRQRLKLMRGGLGWLFKTQLADGGWGDTVKSRANLATTLLVWAALGMGDRIFRNEALGNGSAAAPPEPCLTKKSEEVAALLLEVESAVARTEAWILREAGGLAVKHLKAALGRRFGKDKTFAVPILMACAVGGRLGAAPWCWQEVPTLPFELAAFPRSWFAALRLPVVSYALPALIAIGQARHVQRPVWGPWAWVRQSLLGRTRRLLREIQPKGGGFLEAIPLTGFVTIALCSARAGGGAVVREAVEFLQRAARPDGSWPIDSNLATWGTTLSIKAMGGDFPPDRRAAVRDWLLGQQYQKRHAYCLSAPGGWAWTDLPGGVPDADDTAGALLALRELSGQALAGRHEALAAGASSTPELSGDAGLRNQKAGEAGVRWLMGLQNRDGGIPTFCQGWGALPFDRSAPDLTAHALAAWQAWRGAVAADVRLAMRQAVAWLVKTQRADGAWVPLWFGNEHEADEANPVYGTAVVLKYLCRLDTKEFPELAVVRRKAANFLLLTQQADGTWSGGPGSGPGSIEETGAALEALVALMEPITLMVETKKKGATPNAVTHQLLKSEASNEEEHEAKAPPVIARGALALLRLTAQGMDFPPAPIGLYFARLWYFEKLYPQIAAVAAFRALRGFIVRERGVPAVISTSES